MKYFILLYFCLSFEVFFSQTVIKDTIPKCEPADIFCSFGVAKPLGRYKSLSFEEKDAGGAKSGFNFEVSYLRKITKYFFAEFTFKKTSNSVNINAFEEALRKADPNTNWSASSTPWKINSLFLGGYFPIPSGLMEKLNFDFRVMPGISNVTPRDITVSGSNGSGQAVFHLSGSSATAFTYMVGFDIRYGISTFANIILQVDYLYSNPTFQDNSYTSGGGLISSPPSFSQKIESFYLNMGIGIKMK